VVSATAETVAEWVRLKIAGERYVALTKSVPAGDRHESLSGDVSTIRESLEWHMPELLHKYTCLGHEWHGS
jgi:hypothetical protein